MSKETPIMNRVRLAVAPSSITTELAVIAGRLAQLDTEREGLRLGAGELASAPDGQVSQRKRDAEVRAIHQQIDDIDIERRDLRARRRDLLDLLAGASPGDEAAATVPMPKPLVEAIAALDKAREDRRALMMNGPGDGAKAAAFDKYHADMEAAEERIRALRIDRAGHLGPYHAAVMAALQPVIDAAALRLREAAQAFIAAHAELSTLSGQAPPPGPGLSNGLQAMGFISTAPAKEAVAFANAILGPEAVA